MDIQHVISAVCEALQLEKSLLTKKKQSREYRDARFICIFVIRSVNVPKKKRAKYTELAMLFKKDRKQHATIIYSFRIAQTLIKTDKEFKDKFIKVLEML